MDTYNPRRRYRVTARFGSQPRFVLATSALYARLTVWRLTHD